VLRVCRPDGLGKLGQLADVILGDARART
jgi:hypothetical protein